MDEAQQPWCSLMIVVPRMMATTTWARWRAAPLLEFLFGRVGPNLLLISKWVHPRSRSLSPAHKIHVSFQSSVPHQCQQLPSWWVDDDHSSHNECYPGLNLQDPWIQSRYYYSEFMRILLGRCAVSTTVDNESLLGGTKLDDKTGHNCRCQRKSVLLLAGPLSRRRHLGWLPFRRCTLCKMILQDLDTMMNSNSDTD